MTVYKNFTVDFPERLTELDRQFSPIVRSADLEVSYTLMKLASSFLLPYERIEGTSGARRSEISCPKSIRKYLELDKRFREATYCSNIESWSLFEVDNFSSGPRDWIRRRPRKEMNDVVVWQVLQIIRHSVAHSNFFFGGELAIEHIYLGNWRERGTETEKYHVLQCDIPALNGLIATWISNVQELRVSPALIWRELDEASYDAAGIVR